MTASGIALHSGRLTQTEAELYRISVNGCIESPKGLGVGYIFDQRKVNKYATGHGRLKA
jgi:hypothetical protein